MATRNIVVIGASAGGIEPLRTIIGKLPADFPATVLVVVHMSPSSRSVLPEILTRSSALRVIHARDGLRVEAGTVVVAPPDCHLLFHGERLRVSRGPRENGHRPAVDPLFRSAARWHGSRVVSVVLSGVLDDGTSGSLVVKNGGGVVIAQSPDDALYASMPASVIQTVGADHVASTEELPLLLDRLVREEIEPQERDDDMLHPDTEDEDMLEDPETPPSGPASTFTCPECHGALWELKDGELVRYRCRIGHAYAPESLMDHQWSHVEDALGIAYRALEESSALSKRLGERAKTQGLGEVARLYAEKQADADARAKVIRAALEPTNVPGTAGGGAP